MTRDWREDAACDGRAPLFDATVYGETLEEQKARHERAQDVCETCPVKVKCLAAVDYNRDDGVRGGEVLATLRNAASYGVVEGVRRSPRSDRKAS